MCLHVLCYVHYIIIVDISTSISVKGSKHSSELNVSDDECTSAAKRPKQMKQSNQVSANVLEYLRSSYPHLHGRRVQYLLTICLCVSVCLSVCLSVLPQNCRSSSKSKQATSHELDNLRQKVVLYKTGKFLQASVVCKFENKKLTAQILHKNL